MDHATKQFTRHPFKIGQRIADRYTVRGYLGSGSVGWVLKVSDEALDGAPVALKVLYPHLTRDPNAVERFRAEVVLARQLSHPSIIHVHDLIESGDGELCLAMEHIEGTSLADILAERRGKGLPFDEAMLILVRIAEGLLYAHQQGIVHRDLKPANILIGVDGSVKLSDFGLAKSFQQEFGLTRTGEALGTPLYMAPEQFADARVDQRTDIYAFGVLAFETLSGHPPFADEGFFELARQHTERPLPKLTLGGAPAPEWCADLVERCCAKKAEDRPLSVGDFLPELQRQLPLQTQLRQLTQRKRRPRGGLTRRGQLRALSVGLLLLMVGLFEAGYSQDNFRTFVASNVLAFEFDLGTELPVVKTLLRIKGSLLRPQSVFELLTLQDRKHLKAMLEGRMALRRANLTNIQPLSSLRDANGSTLLHRAIELNIPEILTAFRDVDIEMDRRDTSGETPFTAAIKHRKIKALRALALNARFEADSPNRDGDRPIHIATKLADLAALEIIVWRRGNIDARNRAGMTAIHIAIANGDMPTLRALLRMYNPNLAVQNYDGETPLIFLLTREVFPAELPEVVKLLIDKMPILDDLNARDHQGRTALIHAARRGQPEIVSILLRRWVDRNARDQFGKTAADYADPESLRLLTGGASDAK